MINFFKRLYRRRNTTLQMSDCDTMIVRCGKWVEELHYGDKGWYLYGQDMSQKSKIGYTRYDIRRWALTREVTA